MARKLFVNYLFIYAIRSNAHDAQKSIVKIIKTIKKIVVIYITEA